MKFYRLTVLVEPKNAATEDEIGKEILALIQTDGKERILCMEPEYKGHSVVKKVKTKLFPNCLAKNSGWAEFEIFLPTRKDLGRRWFLKRLKGEEIKHFRLAAMTDVAVIHVEIEDKGSTE